MYMKKKHAYYTFVHIQFIVVIQTAQIIPMAPLLLKEENAKTGKKNNFFFFSKLDGIKRNFYRQNFRVPSLIPESFSFLGEILTEGEMKHTTYIHKHALLQRVTGALQH